jgi:hypothetical protein
VINGLLFVNPSTPELAYLSTHPDISFGTGPNAVANAITALHKHNRNEDKFFIRTMRLTRRTRVSHWQSTPIPMPNAPPPNPRMACLASSSAGFASDAGSNRR